MTDPPVWKHAYASTDDANGTLRGPSRDESFALGTEIAGHPGKIYRRNLAPLSSTRMPRFLSIFSRDIAAVHSEATPRVCHIPEKLSGCLEAEAPNVRKSHQEAVCEKAAHTKISDLQRYVA